MPTAIRMVLARRGTRSGFMPRLHHSVSAIAASRATASHFVLFWSDPAHEWYHHCGYGKADRNHEVGISESLDLRFPIGRLPQFLERCGLPDYRIAPGLDVMAGHPMQPADELRIREIQMFGNAQEMQIGSVVDDGRGYGDADGA